MKTSEILRSLADLVDTIGPLGMIPSAEPEKKEPNMMISPLQQQLELQKAEQGKDDAVIDQITEPDSEERTEPTTPTEVDQELNRIKTLFSYLKP